MREINFGEIRVGDTARHHINQCLDTDWITAGPKVALFEKKWGELFGYKYNKAVSSGTDAVLNLISSLYALGAERGDEVIVPALSFIATSNAVLMAGFTPVFVDIEKETLNIDPSKIEEAITEKTKAILVVHTMGRPCEMDKINEIAKRNALYVFEDACEAHGAKYKGTYVGHWSDGAAFSFYTAHLINSGEGGMVSTSNPKVAASVGCTRSHGREEGSIYFDHIQVGYNSKMNDLEASIALEGVGNFWETYNKRKESLQYLTEALREFEDLVWVSSDNEIDMDICPHGLSMVVKDPKLFEGLTKLLDSFEIQWKRNFGCIPTQHRAYAFMGMKEGAFPNAEYVGSYGLHIGTHQYLSKNDLWYIETRLVDYFLGCLHVKTK